MFPALRSGPAEDGASAAEYAVLLSGIAGVLILVIIALGGQTTGMFEDSCEEIDTQMSASASCS